MVGLIVLGLIVFGVVGFVIQIYNNLVQLRQRVKNAWSQVDVQLKRRYDLIPNLVNTVKGYAEHEKTTLENVTKARTMAMNAAFDWITLPSRMLSSYRNSRRNSRWFIVTAR